MNLPTSPSGKVSTYNTLSVVYRGWETGCVHDDEIVFVDSEPVHGLHTLYTQCGGKVLRKTTSVMGNLSELGLILSTILSKLTA